MSTTATNNAGRLEAKGWSALPAVLFLLLAVGAVRGFLGLFAPTPYEAPLPPFTDYDRGGMIAAMAASNVTARLDDVAALGDRFVGKPGFYAAESLVRECYRAAGLEILEQENLTVVPQTECAEALTETGAPTGCRVYPLMPNCYQPIAMPEAGVTGKVVLVTEEVLRTGRSFTGCFALIDASVPAPVGYGLDYVRYAQLGFAGVIVSHRKLLDDIKWTALVNLTGTMPVNYPRLVAEPGIFDYVDRTLVLRVRVRYREVPNRTLVGVLRSGAAKREALVIPCSYDALSILPDRSPGVVQAGQLAAHLQLLAGLAPHRAALRRDVIFVAFGGRFMAHGAQDRLVAAIGARGDGAARRRALEAAGAAETRALGHIEACAPVVAALAGPEAARVALSAFGALAPDVQAFFSGQLQYVLNTLVFIESERVMAAKIAFEKGDTTDVGGPAFAAYQAARKVYDQAFSCSGMPLARLLRDQQSFVAQRGVAALLRERLSVLREYHVRQQRIAAQGLDLNRLFGEYSQLVVMATELIPRDPESVPGEKLALTMGLHINHSRGGQPGVQAVQSAIQSLGLADTVSLLFQARRDFGGIMHGQLAAQGTEAELWALAGYPAYSLVSAERSYAGFATPCALPWMRDLSTLESSLKVAGAAVLSAAYGNGEFKPLAFNRANIRSIRGNVYVANVGQSLIPNYPLAGALVGCAPVSAETTLKIGYAGQLFLMADPYGHYARDYCLAFFVANALNYSPDAVGYDAGGELYLVKDQGMKAQRYYVSMNLGPESLAREVNIVCYRAAPVTLLDMVNPQTLRAYAGAAFVRTRGVTAFESTFSAGAATEGIQTAFIKPDEYFYVLLKAGSAENELVQTTRAVMLGADVGAGADGLSLREAARPGSEIRGRGYLAAETPFIFNTAGEAAQSLVRVNAQRLRVQDHYGMADELTHTFQQRAEEHLRAAGGPAVSHRDGALRARDALTYATLNHPVLRENIFAAVAGILWYLGLLVPFTFFFEKLIFGFADIRKQIGAHVVIFLTVFVLLKLLHPAFALIRSSVMILLGFIILLISTGILALFSSKFRENLESLRQQRGQVSAAEVNRGGAIATAFMLGLNNMHRRRVRTLLTCGTLVLITFVMICFTSVQSDIVETSTAIGKAPFSGFVVKNEEFRGVSGSEVFALQVKYGDRCQVVTRMAMVGDEDGATRDRMYPDLRLVRRDGDTDRDTRAKSMLYLGAAEPLAAHLGVRGRWFTLEEERSFSAKVPVVLPLAMAAKLGIATADVEAGREVTVEINGRPYPVCGLFDGMALESLLDLDGENLLPFDIKALREINRADWSILAKVDDPRIGGDHVILAPRDLGVSVANAGTRILSAAVVFPPELPPREGREEIRRYMEQSGRLTFFGLDGFAFLGRRARESTFVGLVDMLIPLIIAAITVLNTIRGSVYERKEEIFVYNAVGIAPRHIFFMFFAEAFVYAVVGSVLGYILSQGTGRLLTAAGLTGGLNMTFTSLGTIYASLTIAASVFISTLFPARTAMRIASPSDDPGWRLPEPDGDSLRFRLPFTFDWRDRIAVLVFFRRYFVDHGEGSSGAFFAGVPRLGLAAESDPLSGGYVPTLTVPVWLKPFDLGVSQEVCIAMPTDTETREYVADIRLTRQSGTLENWIRLNRVFVGMVRTHFLHWRAVKPAERAGMHVEAGNLLRTEVAHG